MGFALEPTGLAMRLGYPKNKPNTHLRNASDTRTHTLTHTHTHTQLGSKHKGQTEQQTQVRQAGRQTGRQMDRQSVGAGRTDELADREDREDS